MNIVKRDVTLNDTITQVEQGSTALRQDILCGGVDVQSNQSVGTMRQQVPRGSKANLVPSDNLNGPLFWDVAPRDDVNRRAVEGCPTFLRPETQVQIDLLRYRC